MTLRTRLESAIATHLDACVAKALAFLEAPAGVDGVDDFAQEFDALEQAARKGAEAMVVCGVIDAGRSGTIRNRCLKAALGRLPEADLARLLARVPTLVIDELLADEGARHRIVDPALNREISARPRRLVERVDRIRCVLAEATAPHRAAQRNETSHRVSHIAEGTRAVAALRLHVEAHLLAEAWKAHPAVTEFRALVERVIERTPGFCNALADADLAAIHHAVRQLDLPTSLAILTTEIEARESGRRV